MIIHGYCNPHPAARNRFYEIINYEFDRKFIGKKAASNELLLYDLREKRHLQYMSFGCGSGGAKMHSTRIR